jgi:hypothetical protein
MFVVAMRGTMGRLVFMIVPPVAADGGRPSWRPASVRGSRLGGDQPCIELSPAQVAQVVRAASEGGGISTLLSGIGDARVLVTARAGLDDPRLSRSLLSGLLLLAAFPADGSYLRGSEAARMLGMSPSTTYRYLATLVAVGLLEQDSHTRQYRLADAG